MLGGEVSLELRSRRYQGRRSLAGARAQPESPISRLPFLPGVVMESLRSTPLPTRSAGKPPRAARSARSIWRKGMNVFIEPVGGSSRFALVRGAGAIRPRAMDR